MGRQQRTSLSDWWKRSEHVCQHVLPEDSDAESKAESKADFEDSTQQQCIEHPPTDPANLNFSPRKRSGSNFFIGDGDTSDDHSRECSPRKRATLTSGDSDINAAMMAMFKGLCADYVENNVSPILRYIQQGQDQLMTQLKDLARSVDDKANIGDVMQTQESLRLQLQELSCVLSKKANAEDVFALEHIEQVSAKVATAKVDEIKAAIHARLEELSTAMEHKANVANVPTCAQLAQKADAKNVATSAQLAELAATVHRSMEVADPQDLQMRLRVAEEKVASLSEELRELKSADIVGACEGTGPSDMIRVKTVFAAAGLRVDRQLKEMRQQMQKMREDCLGQDVGERWPGRRLSSDSASVFSVQSDNDSDKLSVGASACASSTLDPEEKAELRKIKAIVAAAGTTFSRDMREVKSQMCEFQNELRTVKLLLDR